eukprot:TRINITY_DN11584_c0_g1_i1.p2 TRINITY_DN11584_c0_g1~~TRINITY_DN11584_c0_g1_i1.p2  ORF type:complete len:101 (-),score=16.33 TRINITY_DN11584_c0_g1_i1:362-664(-)
MCSSGRGSWKSEFRILIAIGFGRERDGDGDGDGGGDPLVFAFSSHRLEESGGNKERNRRERERKSELVHIGGPTCGVSCCALHLENWPHRRKVQMCREFS